MAINSIPTKEKIGCALSYLTFGIWGLIWLLFSRRTLYSQKHFVIYNIYQSMFLGLVSSFIPYGISTISGLLATTLGLIPGVATIAIPIVKLFSFISTFFFLVCSFATIIAAILCIMNKYPTIPFISQLINRMLR